jgi:sugar fermentation stimulation protein A
VEVKSVTLKLDEVAQFPDAVTERGQKHLIELMELKKKGFRTVMLYIVQREDVDRMRPAHSIDVNYGKLLKEAFHSGVEVLVYQCKMGTEEIKLKRRIPLDLE